MQAGADDAIHRFHVVGKEGLQGFEAHFWRVLCTVKDRHINRMGAFACPWTWVATKV
jgi:hypothetical protein